jgi:putative oxidoreductase
VPSFGRLVTDHRLATLARVAIGALFVYAALTKLEPTKFAQEVNNYRLVPMSLVNPVAIALPVIELLAGLLLVVGLRTRGAALTVAGCLAAFILAMGWAHSQGIDIECGCFGRGTRIGLRAIAEDVGMLALAVHAYLFDRGRFALDRLIAARFAPRS